MLGRAGAFVFDRTVAGAAEAWYEHRAHELIRRVKITYRSATGDEPRDIRAFHAIRGADDGSFKYEPIERIAESPILRQMLLRDARREWQTLKSRYAHLDEFLQMVASDLKAAA